MKYYLTVYICNTQQCVEPEKKDQVESSQRKCLIHVRNLMKDFYLDLACEHFRFVIHFNKLSDLILMLIF